MSNLIHFPKRDIIQELRSFFDDSAFIVCGKKDGDFKAFVGSDLTYMERLFAVDTLRRMIEEFEGVDDGPSS